MSAIGKFAAGVVAVGVSAGMFGVLAWPDDPVESVVRSARAVVGPVVRVANVPSDRAEGMPTSLLSCATSSVESISDRFGKPIGTPGCIGNCGSYVKFANGGGSISYSIVPGIANSWERDRVLICLVHIPDPNKCPAGDERGRKYTITNLRTLEVWVGGPDQHLCGGA